MKRIFAAVLAAVMLLTSCTATPPEETSPADAAVEMGYLTGIYSTAAEAVAEFTTTPILPLDPADLTAGYRYAHTMGRQMNLVTLKDGKESVVTHVAEEYIYAVAIAGEHVYSLEQHNSPDTLMLCQYDTEGQLLRKTDLLPCAPADDRNFPLHPGMNSASRIIPITETDSGYSLIWGNLLITLNTELSDPVTRAFPSELNGIFLDDADGSVWVSYTDEADLLENTETGAVITLPAAEKQDNRSVIGIHNGRIYCMDRKSVFSLNPADMTAEELMNFENSLLLYTPYTIVPVFAGDEVHLSIQSLDDTAFKCPLLYCTPGEDIPLSEITVLELVTAGRNRNLSQTVFAFNTSHRNCRILIDDYSRFNTDDDINAGLNRLRLDLETGILSPDLIITDARSYHDAITSSPDLFLDLYTLDYSDAEYTPDDLWTAVRHAGEVDGKLYAVLPDFSLQGLAGLNAYTGDIDSWNLEEFLDWTDTLSDREYIMDEYGRDTYPLPFGYGYQILHFYRQGTFDDPLYTRYLNFIHALPAKGPKIQQKRSTVMDPDDWLLDYEKADEPYDAGGENMYQNGTIKLTQFGTSSISGIVRFLDTLGVDSVSEVNFMGYPSGIGRGFEVVAGFDNIISIHAKSEHPEMAWKFAEFMLQEGADIADNSHGMMRAPGSPYNTAVPSLKQPALDYLKSMEGTQIYYDYSNDGLVTDPEQIEKRQRDRIPGRLYTIDSAVTELYTDLLDSELMTLADDTTLEFRSIVGQEESAMLNGEQTVQTTAEAVASRTAIYIAEKN